MKKAIYLFIVVIFSFPMFVFASSATCTYTYNMTQVTIYYEYGEELTYSAEYANNNKNNELKAVNIEVQDIVDSSGNISCPKMSASRTHKSSGHNRWWLTLSVNPDGNLEGTLNITNADDKEKDSPDSGTHACIWNQGTDAEFRLTWNGSKVVVNLTGSKYRNYCPTSITQSEFSASDFADQSCPSIHSLAVARYENLSNCKGRLMISKNPIMTENETPSQADGGENIYDGTEFEVEYDEIEIVPLQPKEENCDSLLGSTTCSTGSNCEPAFYLQIAFTVMKYAAIIILIVMTMFESIGSLTSNDDGAMKKSLNKCIIRLVLCVLIFFAPVILEYLFTWMKVYTPSTCNIK